MRRVGRWSGSDRGGGSGRPAKSPALRRCLAVAVAVPLLISLSTGRAEAPPDTPHAQFALDTGIAASPASDGFGPGADTMLRVTWRHGFHLGFGGGASMAFGYSDSPRAWLRTRFVVGGTWDRYRTLRVHLETSIGFGTVLSSSASGRVYDQPRLFAFGGRITILRLVPATGPRGAIGGFFGSGVHFGPSSDTGGFWPLPWVEVGVAWELGDYRRTLPAHEF